MFTGIVEATGRVLRTSPSPAGLRLKVALGTAVARGVKPGDSIAVNGCCLTVAALRGAQAQFDVIPETLGLTTFGAMRAGDAVNLERASRIGDRLDGHIVQGHVDGLVTVLRDGGNGDNLARARKPGKRRAAAGNGGWGEARTWTFRCAPELTAQMVLKGSIAVDGISLTIADLTTDTFSVAIIPETLRRTTLGSKLAGAQCHVELDVLGKYVLRLLSGMRPTLAMHMPTGRSRTGRTGRSRSAALVDRPGRDSKPRGRRST